ncbi:MAG TPA: hypothetical protein DEH78_08170 [Solibacterales bacterium]|nr:hypothetical protein [Bryobacterales bacterium]
MPDPVTGKVISTALPAPPVDKAAEAGKKGAFESVRAEVAEKAAQPNVPAPVRSVTEAERKQLISEVRRKAETDPSAAPKQVWGPDLEHAAVRIDKMRAGVGRLKDPAQAQSLGAHLQTIDEQFQKASSIMSRLPDMQDPRALLELQMEMYQMTQNLELVSKAVEQMNSGLKTVMQTQV